MFLFLIPLLLGFACNLASAFTADWSRRWGAQAVTRVPAFLPRLKRKSP
jgi:Zn-dependent protease with chaperone function